MQKIIRSDRLESVVSRFDSLGVNNLEPNSYQLITQELLEELKCLIADSEMAMVITADTVIEAISEDELSASANSDIDADFHNWRADNDIAFSCEALSDYYESDSYAKAVERYKYKVLDYCFELNDYGLSSLESAVYDAVSTLVETAK